MLQRADLPSRFNTIHAWHTHIHQHHVRMQCFRQRQGFRTIASLCRDRHIRLGADHHSKTGTYQFLIIGNDHMNLLFFTHTLHLIGIVPLTVQNKSLHLPENLNRLSRHALQLLLQRCCRPQLQFARATGMSVIAETSLAKHTKQFAHTFERGSPLLADRLER